MKPNIEDIAQAVIDSAYARLEKHGLTTQSPALARALHQEIASRESAVRATLFTPDGNAGLLATAIHKELEKQLGRRVEFVEEADSAMLGGAMLQYGDMRIDVSLRGALNEARRILEDSSLT